MKNFLKTNLIISLLFILVSCSSTGTKNMTELTSPSSTMANIYVKRSGGFILGGTRALIKVNNQKVGSLYPNDFLKVEAYPGSVMFTIAGDPLSGVIGSTSIALDARAGGAYYFITGPSSGKGLGIFLGGLLGQAATGGPFTIQQVNKEAYFGYSYSPSSTSSQSQTSSSISQTSQTKQQSATSNSGGKSIAERYKELNELYKQGLITDEVYNQKVDQLMNEI